MAMFFCIRSCSLCLNLTYPGSCGFPGEKCSSTVWVFVFVHMDSPLHPLLFTIAKWRAIDLRRMASCRIRADVELTEEVGEYLAGTETGRDWRLVVTLGKANEVSEEFRQFVGTLKGQQRRVASVMADFLP